ncbi:hypothetical protein H0H87_004494 [Tephrocybe sp. NHM501043]|nr:hypothetical protein H0H87_004494 [Tephrocybe sp. NHM501043]
MAGKRGYVLSSYSSNQSSSSLEKVVPVKASNICAKLTTMRGERREAVVLSLEKPAIIGRDPSVCVRSPSGGIIVSCQDVSRNGLYLNGQHIRKTAIILMDGDLLRLPGSLGTGSFATVHLALDPVKRRQVACKSIRTKREHDVEQVMKELCTGGDLFTYITNHPSSKNRLCEAEAKYVMYQLLRGLHYLHANMISHRGMLS